MLPASHSLHFRVHTRVLTTLLIALAITVLLFVSTARAVAAAPEAITFRAE